MFEFSAEQTGIIFAIYLLSATAKGVTGLGFSTMCLPFLAMTVGLKEALPLLIIPSIATNLMVMHGAGQFSVAIRRFWPMLGATVPGLALGLWALALVDGRLAGAVLGGVLLAWCVFAYVNPEMRLPAAWARALGPISGFLTGGLNGITGSQMMPVTPYLMALQLDRNLFIQTINCSFTLSSLIMAVGLNRMGLFTVDATILSIVGVALAFTGVRLGERIRHRLSSKRFRLALLCMLVVVGLGLIVRAV